MLAVVLAAGAAQAQGKGQIAFEAPGEANRPVQLSQGQAPNSALGQTHHGYYYSQCYNYYRWYYDRWYGWQRYCLRGHPLLLSARNPTELHSGGLARGRRFRFATGAEQQRVLCPVIASLEARDDERAASVWD